jgi:hypothetical protein
VKLLAAKEKKVTCPFCQQPLDKPHLSKCPALTTIGRTISFDDVVQFQRVEATSTDLESLVMLERMIARGEIPRQTSNLMMYVMAIGIGLIIVTIALYMMKEFHIIP